MKKSILLFVAVLFLMINSFSQGVSINTTNTLPDGSAILDISSDSLGVLIPRMTREQRNAITNPAAGLMVCQTDNIIGFYYFNGTNWVAIGKEALGINDLTDGKTTHSSIFLGVGSGNNEVDTNKMNVGIGDSVLFNNISGEKNTAYGYRSLRTNTSGESNTASGYQSSFFNTTGSSNTVFGFNANAFNQEGSNNTIVGCEAGRAAAFHNKSGSVFLGYRAGISDTTDNKLYIENSGSSSPLIWGDFANDTVRINGTLDIADVYHFPTVDGTDGQVLQSDGDGTLSWDNGGASEINDLSDGKTINSSIYLGATAAPNALGNANIGIGVDALHDSEWGYDNVAVGYYTLSEIENTGFNVAVGSYALSNSLGSYNSAYGANAMRNHVNGSYNTAVGGVAGYSLINGDSNTFVGYLAGGSYNAHNTTGNVCLGHMAGSGETTNHKLYIENTNSSSPLIWGDFANDTVRINGTFDIRGEYNFPDTIGGEGQMLQSDGSGSLIWKDHAYSFGDYAQGGIVYWVDNTGQHGLVCALNEQSDGIRWYAGTYGVTRAKGDAPFSGEMNTAITVSSQVAIGDDGVNYAAYLCSKLWVTFNGKKYGDWYLPSKRELELIHLNHMEINSAIIAHGGTTIPYSGHWSSTEDDGNNAWMEYFSVGGPQSSVSKDQDFNVRAIRAF